jgi:hypothetical protein
MEIIKKNLVVIFIVLTLLILILIRSTGINHFSTDAKSHAEASINQSNTITLDKLGSLKGNKLLVNLSGDVKALSKGELKISPDSILAKNHINSIMKNDGPVVLYSSDPAITARIWMLLSQMGRKNIFILINTSDDEILKYKFHPDSLSQNN